MRTSLSWVGAIALLLCSCAAHVEKERAERQPWEPGGPPIAAADGYGCYVDSDCGGGGYWCSSTHYCKTPSNPP
jgi:hypothetical protein